MLKFCLDLNGWNIGMIYCPWDSPIRCRHVARSAPTTPDSRVSFLFVLATTRSRNGRTALFSSRRGKQPRYELLLRLHGPKGISNAADTCCSCPSAFICVFGFQILHCYPLSPSPHYALIEIVKRNALSSRFQKLDTAVRFQFNRPFKCCEFM